jgi:hypothetical protein
MNSRIAWSYERFELEDVRLFKTADFDCSRSGNLKTVFGTRLRLFLAIGSGLRCRGEKHDPDPDLLTSSAFLWTNHCNRTAQTVFTIFVELGVVDDTIQLDLRAPEAKAYVSSRRNVAGVQTPPVVNSSTTEQPGDCAGFMFSVGPQTGQ